jgi:hypothetical protein
MADYKPNSCETCYCYGMDHDSNLKACWHCTVSGHHTFESKNFWEPTEWFEAYQQLEKQLALISSRRDELERWYSEHVAATAQLRDDLAAANDRITLAIDMARREGNQERAGWVRGVVDSERIIDVLEGEQ